MSGNAMTTMLATLDLWIFRDQPLGWMESLQNLSFPLAIAVIIVVFGLVLGLWAGLDLRKRQTSVASGLSRRFARRLGLPWRDWRLLRRVARQGGLRITAAMLISEGCFDVIASRATLSAADRARLFAIRRAVFAAETASE